MNRKSISVTESKSRGGASTSSRSGDRGQGICEPTWRTVSSDQYLRGIGANARYNLVCSNKPLICSITGAFKTVSAPLTQKPYGVPCMVKLFTFVCSLIQPARTNSDAIRLLGLNLINTVLETQPPEALFPGLLTIIQDDLCRHLMLVLSSNMIALGMQISHEIFCSLQNLLTSDLTIFTLTLRVFYHLFVSYKASLKLQFEAFFTCLLNRCETSTTPTPRSFNIDLPPPVSWKAKEPRTRSRNWHWKCCSSFALSPIS